MAGAGDKAMVSLTRAWSGTAKELILPQCSEGEFSAVTVTIEPPKGVERTPSDIVCVIDISGSMSDVAEIKSESGASESHGLTLLDIAKHGVKTVIHTLSDKDRLAVVLFNHEASTLFELTVMDEAGKKKADDELEPVGPGGGTNLWQGINQAYELLRGSNREGRFGHVMLLTDGQTVGRAAVRPNMSEYLSKHEKFPGTLSCFGFGYNIDSPLLELVSTLGHGAYAFIPDAGFVGTVFVNSLSNLLCTAAMEVNMSLTLEDCELHFPIGVPYKGDYGDLFKVQGEGTELFLSIGNFQYDQPRTIALGVKPKAGGRPNICAAVSYVTPSGEKISTDSAELDWNEGEESKEGRIMLHRLVFAGLAMFATNPEGGGALHMLELAGVPLNEGAESQRKQAAKFFQLYSEVLKADKKVMDDERMQALLKDVEGQASEAVSRRDWLERWGGHYLRSVMFAHRCQLCNNFKDPGVQFYGGDLFKDVQEKADDLFNTLPPPKPSGRRGSMGGGYGGRGSVASSSPAPVVNMAMYNNSCGVCIDSACEVQMADGSRSAVGLLLKGDVVATPAGTAKVICVAHTACEGGRANLVHLAGGVRVTAYHPIFVDGAWVFPYQLAAPEDTECGSVCSVLLEGGDALMVGSEEPVACAALGHGMEEGAARHPYFSSERVLEDLRSFPGFEAGRVELTADDVVRDTETGLVCQYRRLA